MKDLISFKEIGEVLGISETQARRDYKNAIAKIEARLEKAPKLKAALLAEIFE